MENNTVRTNERRPVKQLMIEIGKYLKKNRAQLARESKMPETSFAKDKENQKINADAFVEFMAQNPEINFDHFINQNEPMFKTEITQTGFNNHQYNNTGKGTQNNIHSLGNQFNFAANAAENLKIIRNYFESNAERGTADEYARRTLDRLEQQIQQYETIIQHKDAIIEHKEMTIQSQKQLIDILQQTVENQKK